MTNTALPSSTGTGLMYPKTKSDPAWDLWAETLAPYEALLRQCRERLSPTCRDTFFQWWQDANPGGFSARMFLHLTCLTSCEHWSCLDTERMLSLWTPSHSPGKVGFVSSWRDSISRKHLIGSTERALSPRAVRGWAKRMFDLRRPSYVLLRDGAEWILVKITCMKKGRDYVFSHILSESLYKDSLLDGLTEYLNRLANAPSATPSPSPSPNGSEKE